VVLAGQAELLIGTETDGRCDVEVDLSVITTSAIEPE
jgi:hypothetical protein